MQLRNARRQRSQQHDDVSTVKKLKKEEKKKLLDDDDFTAKGTAVELQEWDLMKKLEEGWKDASVKLGTPPPWVGIIDEVHYDVSRVKQKMKELAEAHKKHLLPKFEGDSEQGLEEEREIEILTDFITKTFQAAQTRIQRLSQKDSAASKEGKTKEERKAEKQMKKNVQQMLALQLQTLSTQFRRQQQDYLQKLRGKRSKSKRASSGVSSAGNESPIPGNRNDFDDSDIDFDTGFSQNQIMSAMQHEDSISSREREIIGLAKSINDLANVFKDLSILVIEQGTILDRIDFNVEQALTNASEGVKELDKAKKSQKAYTRKLCMLLLCLAIGMVVIFIIFKAALK